MHNFSANINRVGSAGKGCDVYMRDLKDRAVRSINTYTAQLKASRLSLIDPLFISNNKTIQIVNPPE